MTTRKTEIHLWPCGDTAFFIFLLLIIILCVGEPDLLDAIINRVMESPKQVEQPTVLLGEEGDFSLAPGTLIWRMLEREGKDPSKYRMIQQ